MRDLFRKPWVGPLLAIIAVCTLFGALRPDAFFRAANLVAILDQTVVVALCAIGMTMVIAHGGIDLSVGSSAAVASIVVALCLREGIGAPLAALAGIAASAFAGVVIGLLVALLRIAPFIVTLGAMSLLRGVGKGLASNQKIDAPSRGLDSLTDASLGVSPAVWIVLVMAIAFALVLRTTRFGRHVFAVGSNEQAARLSGIHVARVKILVYTLSGALVGVAGLMLFSRLTVGDPTTSEGLELSAIAAVVIGGASFSGGEGSIAGSVLGALLMTAIASGCQMVDLPNWVQEIVTGIIIVAAVGLDRLRHRRTA